MKIKISPFLMAFMVFSASAFSQDYAFKVLVNKGNNEVKSGGANWQPIKVGSNLKEGQELKISENAYLGLVHANGKPLEVKKAGNYKVIDLAAKVQGKGSTVLNTWTDFMLSSNEKSSNRLAATGAVHRGTEGIKLFLPVPESSLIFSDNIILQWDKASGPAPYVVSFSNVFGDALYVEETSDNMVSVNLNGDKLKEEDIVIVKVSSKDGTKQSVEHMLKKLSKLDKDRIKPAFSEVASQTSEPNALNKYYQATFYENNKPKLLIDAATAYMEAIKLEPQAAEMYQQLYEDFLVRNGLKEAPKDK